MRMRYLILFIIIAVVLPVASAGSVIVSNGYEVSVIHSSSDLKLSATTFNGLTDKMNPYNSSGSNKRYKHGENNRNGNHKIFAHA